MTTPRATSADSEDDTEGHGGPKNRGRGDGDDTEGQQAADGEDDTEGHGGPENLGRGSR